jgi:PKD repeat protein
MDVTSTKKVFLPVFMLLALAAFGTSVSANVLSIENGLVGTIGDTDAINMTLDSAPTGLSGYSINVTIDDPSVATISGVSFPEWASLHDTTMLPSSSCRIKATDMNEQVQAGATNINLATVTIQGLKGGSTPVTLTLNKMNDDDDALLSPTIVSGTFTVDVPISPTAAFTANVTSGTAPLIVQFTDQSSGSPTSWSWSFKNDTVGWTTFSVVQNPSYVFPAGSYDINLTATNDAGSDGEIKTGYIVVTGTVPTIDINATGGVSSWLFNLGNNEDTTSVDLSVITTASNWHVSVKDAMDDGKPADTLGKMSEYTGSTYVTSGYHALTNALQVKSGTGSYIPLSGNYQTIQTGTSSGTFDYDICLKQEIGAGDPVLSTPNVYRIVITFTGATD